MITICLPQKLNFVSESELRSVMSYLSEHEHYCFIDYTFEAHSKYRQLHCHAICKIPQKRLLYKYAGFRIFYSKIYDYRGAMQYLYKYASNRYLQEQIITENYYNYIPRFV